MTDDDIAEYLGIFHEDVGVPSLSVVVPEHAYEKYRDSVPHALLEIWRRDGWCAYADGIFWTVNPEEYQDILEAWLEDTLFAGRDEYFVYGRSAFGTLYVWCKRARRVITVCCAASGIIAFGKDFEPGSEMTDNDFLAKFSIKLRSDFDFGDDSDDDHLFFDAAKDRLGLLASNEMYGFIPALIAGGRADLGNLQKLRLDTHLMILRGFSAPDVPYWNFNIENYYEAP